MNSYKYCLQQALNYLNQLQIDENTNALWDILHIIRWHKAIDYVMWLDDNKDLVAQIIPYPYFKDVPDSTKDLVWQSIQKLKMLNK